jgi:hypothetical protein
MFKNVMQMSLEELALHTIKMQLIHKQPAQRAEQLQCDPYDGYDDCGCRDDEEEDFQYVIL